MAQTRMDLNLSVAEATPAGALARVRGNLGSGYVVVGSYLSSSAVGGGLDSSGKSVSEISDPET